MKKENAVDSNEKNNSTKNNLESQKVVNHYPKGLENLGLSCYMNSILQCLFYIKELRDFFIK